MKDGGCKGGTCNKNPDTHIKVWWGRGTYWQPAQKYLPRGKALWN